MSHFGMIEILANIRIGDFTTLERRLERQAHKTRAAAFLVQHLKVNFKEGAVDDGR